MSRPTRTPNPIPNQALKTRKTRQLRIGEREITAMCELLGKRLNEREACEVLGIAMATWSRWKGHARNSEKLRRLLDRISGTKIKTHLSNIEAKSEKEWRASAYVLSATDPTRFSTTGGAPQPPTPPPPALAITTINTWLSLAYRAQSLEPATPLIDVEPVKQLEDSTSKKMPPTPGTVN